jgi:L-rhamnose-H+ transport protein
MPAPANPILGTLFHACGGLCASLCYTPQKKIRAWSWETYWLAQAAFCWLILPIVGALLTIPELGAVLAEAPKAAMLRSFGLGVLYGVGGISFGVAIRYLGFALTYSLAVGLSSVIGTLLPPLVAGRLGAMLAGHGGGWVIGGVLIGAVGIGICGWSGWLKESDLKGSAVPGTFSARKGVPLCLLAGVLSAVFSFSLAAGQPVADVAAAHGAGHYQGNVIYLFSNTGAFVTSAIYCLWLGWRNRSLGEYASAETPLTANWLLAALSGLLWYCQFFFYGLGHTRMGPYGFSSWALHMILLVAFSNVLGLALREWRGCRTRTVRVLALALTVLVAAVLTIAYGNNLGSASS